MSTTPPPIQARLKALKQRDFGQVQGKFHSHITVAVTRGEGEGAQIEQLRGWCRQRKIKLTVIDLSRQDRHQRDVMTTQHYKIEAEDAVEQIIDQLIALCEALEDSGYTILRVKLEHESLPTLNTFSAAQYREVHIKLKLDAQGYEQQLQALRELGQTHHFVPSSNPHERHEDYVAQFINLRIYEGDLARADAHVAQLQAALIAQRFDIIQTKAETTIFDTNLALDRWWA